MNKFIFLLLLFTFVNTSLRAQRNVLEGIEMIREYHNISFAYDASLSLDIIYNGSKLKGKDLEADLNQLFSSTNISYTIKKSHIVLTEIKYFTVKGVVKDKDSGRPLIGATIINSNNNGVYSENGGVYTFLTKDTLITIECSYTGYKSIEHELVVGSDTTINFNLELLYRDIDIVVEKKSDIMNDNIKYLSNINQDGSQLIQSEDMRYLPSLGGIHDVIKYLQIIPGVSFGRDASSDLVIRGGSVDQTLVLLDGVPVYNQSHAFGYASIFAGETIESIELNKGYIHPQYGGRLSGVVNMKMRDGNKSEHSQIIQVGLTTISLGAEGPINCGKGSYLVSGRICPLGYSNISSINNSIIPAVNFHDITGRFYYSFNNNNQIVLSIYSGRDIFELQDEFSSNLDSELITTQKYGISWGNSLASLQLKSILSTKLEMSNMIYGSLLQNQNMTEMYNSVNSQISLKKNASITDIGYKIKFDYRINDNHSLDYGGDIVFMQFSPQNTIYESNYIKTDEHIASSLYHRSGSIYFNSNIIYGKFDAKIGVRGAVYDESMVIEPRLSISYTNKNVLLWASYINNYQPLSSINEYYMSIPTSYWVPNNNEKLQQSNQYSFGASTELKNLVFTLEAYHKTIKEGNFIYDTDSYLTNNSGYYIGSSENYGLEFMVQYHKNRVTFVGSYTYSKINVDIRNSERYIFDIPHYANLLCVFNTVKRKKNKQNLSLNVKYNSGMPSRVTNEMYHLFHDDDLYDYSDATYYTEFGTMRLRDYFRADISYTFEKKMRRGTRSWQISIINFTNYKNPYIIVPIRGEGDFDNIRNKYRGYSLMPIFPSFSYTRTF